MNIKLTQTVKKGGCAAKVAAASLRAILKNVQFPLVGPDVLVDGRDFDDAAIYRVGDNLGIVQTLDFFTPIVDSPGLFGQIAAANALSDIYAMGGIPKTAMAILAFPVAEFEDSIVTEILNGACRKIGESGAALVGGHSIDDETLKFGLSCTGTVALDRVWQNNAAKVGDKLILTKPLGTGTLCAGLKKGVYTEEQILEALESMCQLNRVVEIIDPGLLESIHAATDITGFGLAGHAMQLAKASNISLRIDYQTLPLFKLTKASLAQGNLTKAHKSNKDYTATSLNLGDLSEQDALVLFDPQTSGGLLLSVAPEHADKIIEQVKAHFPRATLIGEMIGATDQSVIVR